MENSKRRKKGIDKGGAKMRVRRVEKKGRVEEGMGKMKWTRRKGKQDKGDGSEKYKSKRTKRTCLPYLPTHLNCAELSSLNLKGIRIEVTVEYSMRGMPARQVTSTSSWRVLRLMRGPSCPGR